MRFLLPLLIFLQAAGASSDRALQETLNSKYSRQVLTTRQFLIGPRILFDADGKLVSGGTPGIFTLDGSLRVEGVRVTADRVEIRGQQVFLSYNPKAQKLEEYPTNDSMRLEFARKSGVSVEPGIDSVLLPLDKVAMFVPPYWVRFLEGKVELQPVKDATTGVLVPRASESLGLVPRAKRPITPKYPPILKLYGIVREVLLHVIVDENGKPEVADIIEPAGFGLDQMAIVAVEEGDYEPARQDGKGVKVYFRVRVRFNPPR